MSKLSIAKKALGLSEKALGRVKNKISTIAFEKSPEWTRKMYISLTAKGYSSREAEHSILTAAGKKSIGTQILLEKLGWRYKK